MKFIEQHPNTLTDNEIDAGIAWCSTRAPHFGKLTGLRSEKLRRQFEQKLAAAIKASPTLDGTTTVTLS